MNPILDDILIGEAKYHFIGVCHHVAHRVLYPLYLIRSSIIGRAVESAKRDIWLVRNENTTYRRKCAQCSEVLPT
jgi:hypothetical protein